MRVRIRKVNSSIPPFLSSELLHMHPTNPTICNPGGKRGWVRKSPGVSLLGHRARQRKDGDWILSVLLEMVSRKALGAGNDPENLGGLNSTVTEMDLPPSPSCHRGVPCWHQIPDKGKPSVTGFAVVMFNFIFLFS